MNERLAALEQRLALGEVWESWLTDLRETYAQLTRSRATCSEDTSLLEAFDRQRDILMHLYELHLNQSNLRMTRSAGTLAAVTLVLVIVALIAGIMA